MIKVKYPTSDEARGVLFDTVLERRAAIPEGEPNPLADSFVTNISDARDDLSDGVSSRDTAKSGQVAATGALVEARKPTALGIRHYHANHRMFIKRGLSDPAERAHFGLDTSNLRVPLLNTDEQIAIALNAVLNGEDARRDDGNVPIPIPSPEDLQTLKTTFSGKMTLQAEAKLAYNEAQNALELLRKEVARLIRVIYGTLKLFYKSQGRTNADVRRILREWGFSFVSDSGEPVDEEQNLELSGDDPEGSEEAA